MKLYRHYKNKPYKYIGQAKHSETLEDMVIYETRYENELGKLWVRPKKMFFETVEVNGSSMPRFKEIGLDMAGTTQVGEAEIEFIATIMKSAFGEWDPKWFNSTFRNHRQFFLVKAQIEGRPVGFKLGYETTGQEFYSWLGGVAPEFRGIGIASEMMAFQHNWCRENGYERVQTKTQNRFRAMLQLNIRFGFDIVGFHDSCEHGAKIVLEKKL